MTGWRAAALAALALTAACHLERRPPATPADLVLWHGTAWTADAERPWAEAVAIREGRLVYVGDDAGASRFIGGGTRVLDISGRMLLPGFIDTHAHPLSGGLELGECNLYDAQTVAEIEGMIRAYAVAHPDLPWVRGNGWALPIFADANPRKEILDRLVPDRPAYFAAADGHSAWVNSRALALAGLTRDTPDPTGGRIERDRRTGEPSGTLREAAVDLVADHLPDYSRAERVGAVRRALAEANRFGITSIVDADVDADYLAAYLEVDQGEGLTARVTTALRVRENVPTDSMVRELVALRATARGATRVHADMVKFFEDGVIEAGTAALLEPYLGRGGERGALVFEPAALTERVVRLDREGFQIHVHAIGDRAIHVTLDALAVARTENPPHDPRPIIAHLELFDPADLPRMRELGVAASFQPFWAQADEYIRKLTEPVLGPARSRWLYPIGSAFATGAVIAGGSDWTVSSLNPLDAMQVAITRRGLEHPAGPAWIPEERVSLPQMLAAYTINAAWALKQERETGSLVIGKQADLVVLDRDLFAQPDTGIHNARVLLTLLEGKPVYRDSSFARAIGGR